MIEVIGVKKDDDFELIGEAAMVNPASAKLEERRKVATIVDVYPDEELVCIEFKDGRREQYKKRQLIMLYPRPVILQGLVSNWEIGDPDCRTILGVIRLMQKKQFGEALLLATQNETTKIFCVTNCQQWLEMKQEYRNNKLKNRKRW